EEIWTRTVDFATVEKTHNTNPYGGSTPTSNGERVVVWHGSAGLYCYDMRGNELWAIDLGDFLHQWGYGTSPVIYNDRVILNTGPGKEIFIAAIDLSSGKTIWRTPEPQEGDGEKNTSGKYMGSWATPLIERVNGEPQVICTLPTRVNGYDPKSGKLIWSCEGISGKRGDLAYSSPLVRNGFCVATGGYRGPSIGFEIQTGNLNSAWRVDENPQSIGSGMFIDDDHYVMANAGPATFQCIAAKTGEVVWKESPKGGKNYWGSIVSGGGHMYVTNQRGDTVVFEPSTEKLKVVQVNKLGESSNSTPAIADGQIFIRTFQHLYCIGE
ncbi:MAG: PQQ-binding-like beta-propeller repeat protein, partial [Pirellulaceae bacterium]|nr:PQQ-binding-like beta-propeller repeat protein [Pirellulaceae bacterium]